MRDAGHPSLRTGAPPCPRVARSGQSRIVQRWAQEGLARRRVTTEDRRVEVGDGRGDQSGKAGDADATTSHLPRRGLRATGRGGVSDGWSLPVRSDGSVRETNRPDGRRHGQGGASDVGASDSVAGRRRWTWGGGWLRHVGVGQRLSTRGSVFRFGAPVCLKSLEDLRFLYFSSWGRRFWMSVEY